MASAEYDLVYLRAAVDQLESYLLSKELYWPLRESSPSGEPAFPPLTIGGMLLTFARARARSLNSGQSAQLSQLQEKMEAARNHWRVAWMNKAAKGFHSRLVLWRNYLEDYRQNPGGNQDRYAYEVRRRAMLQFMLAEIDNPPQAELDLLAGLDQLLKAVFIPDGFIWEKDVEGGFPPETFWYLYGYLKGD